jgi:hypothetical protein
MIPRLPAVGRRTFGIAWIALAAVVPIATDACRGATQVTVTITTELPCSELRGVSIGVAADPALAEERAGAGRFVATTHQCDSPSTVGSIVVTPGASSVGIVVIAGIDVESVSCKPPAYEGCVVARRRLSFVEHGSLEIGIGVSRSCLGVPCDTQTSCVDGKCRSSEALCEGSACGQDPAGPIDGGLDGDTPDQVAEATACPRGDCAPHVVLSGVDMPSELSIAGDDLFVTSDAADGGVLACKTDGCAAPTVLVSQLDPPGVVAADETSLYYSASNVFLRACARPACTSSRLLYGDSYSSIALDSTSVLGVSQFNAYGQSMLKADGGSTYMTNMNPLAGAIDASGAYFFVEAGLVNGILRCPLSGCVPFDTAPQLLRAVADVHSMALDDTHVYWTETDKGLVMRAAKGLAGPADVVASNAKSPRGLALDGAFVYWTEEGTTSDDGTVNSAMKTGGAPLVIARDQHRPYRVAVAGGRVFWTNRVAAGTVESASAR